MLSVHLLQMRLPIKTALQFYMEELDFVCSYLFFFIIYCKTLYICKTLCHYGEGDKCISLCRHQFKCFALFLRSLHVELYSKYKEASIL